ncbi:hypothetical protein PBAL39_02477 [Pedobacter sp. BAL39]|uniref:hypothetical protein n=1 Tax=Pedobacter sp. BAL39 TaxID=391596 RepID=UPI000155A1B7|nr:hypothetical protein [Pedobacter sp. BAL39]EDM38444.1 hypothetical protein PBAL39_02477 [Pedobacter sp. BAL39]
MTKLGFDTSINGNANYFIEKIWKGLTGLSVYMEQEYVRYQQRHLEKFGTPWDGDDYTEFLLPKLHTIRRNDVGLWKKNEELKMVVYKDSINEFQFAPILKCVDLQRIIIEEYTGGAPNIRIDDRLLSDDESHQFALNDGFQDQFDLCGYFGGSFQGMLIHWTSLRY